MIVQDKLLEGHDHPHPLPQQDSKQRHYRTKDKSFPGQAITAPGCLPLGIRVRLVRK